MKNIIAIYILLLLSGLFLSCGTNTADQESEQLQEEPKTIKISNSKKKHKKNEDEVSASLENQLAKLLALNEEGMNEKDIKAVQDMMNGDLQGAKADSLLLMINQKVKKNSDPFRKQNHQARAKKLEKKIKAVEDRKKGYFKNLSEEELAIAKKIPFYGRSTQIHNVEEAQEMVDFLEPMNLKRFKKDTSVTKGFKYFYNGGLKLLGKSKMLIKNSKKVEAAFKKKNPSLDFGEVVGKTYFNENGKGIYLPLGALSFADTLLHYKDVPDLTLPMDQCIGEPDYEYYPAYLPDNGLASIGLGGQITVQFTNNALVNVNGPDLYVFELGKVEPTQLEISKDGKNWINVGKIEGGTAQVDIADFVEENELFYFVRLTDLHSTSGVPGADIDAIAAIGAAIRLSLNAEVLFDFGDANLKEEGIKALHELKEQLNNIDQAQIIVEGHTDDIGSNAANQALSKKRANSVSSELKKLLSSKTGLSFKEMGKGESSPLHPNDSDENRQKNRRVEILIVPK